MTTNIGDKRKSFSRRKFLKIGLAGAAGAVVVERSVHYFNQSGAKARIVIVGGGAAGITMAAYLSHMIRDYDITIIEPNEKHYYQPGYTLIAAGVFTPGEVVKPTKDLIPDHVKWIKDSVTELHPDANTVVTAKEGKFSYDFLVMVPGCQMNFDLVEGISREELGKGNVHSIYDYNSAVRCWEAIKSLPNSTSKKLVFTNAYTKIKCGGAPKKICLITDDHLRKEDKRNDFQISYYANQKELMKPKIFGDRLSEIFKERNIETNYCHRLISVDTSAKKAVFMKLPESVTTAVLADGIGEKVEVDFDFLHIVPPMSAPDFVRNSELSGDPEQGSWVKVDKETLVHAKYKNIICFGDVAGLPTSKTGAAIRKQAPIAAANLVSLMEGKVPQLKYDGYSACPIVTEYGKVLMCEFGYDEKLLPTIPFIDPGIERGIWWILKVHGLKPMYYQGMLKGLM